MTVEGNGYFVAGVGFSIKAEWRILL